MTSRLMQTRRLSLTRHCYTIINEEFKFGPKQFLPCPSSVVTLMTFLVRRFPSLLQHELYHPELLLIKDSFLNSVEEGLDLLRTDKISGQKVVVRASDVEK